MHELYLQRPETGGSEDLNAVMDDLNCAASQKVKVYRTFCDAVGEIHCTFMTTSKDLHLSLGALSWHGQFHLGRLIEREFTGEVACDSLLIIRDAKKDSAILVTRSVDDKGHPIFHLSPAH